MSNREVKSLSEAKARIEEVLKKEKKVSPPVNVEPQRKKGEGNTAEHANGTTRLG